MVSLQADKTCIEICYEYSDFADVILANFAMKLLEYNRKTHYDIKLIKTKKLLYRSIYSLCPVELEILKTYIKIYLKTRFIQFFKCFARSRIVLDQKFNKIFCL